MSAHDFLLHNQPTASTVRVLWYLNTFFQEKPWQDGLAYEQELRGCRLDYSPESLFRIDALLQSIRQNEAPDAESFFEQLDKQNFLSVLAFYCGETVGRTRRQAAVWLHYGEFAEQSPELAADYPPALWTDFLAEFRHYDGSKTVFFPLKSICGALFGNDEEQSVLCAAAALMPPDAPAQTPFAEPPPQSLDFSIRHALSATEPAQLPYLQMLAPNGLANEPLWLQINALGTLYSQGRVVWAAAVEPSPLLAESGNTRPATVEIVYDPSGRTDTETLRQAARSLAILRHSDEDEEDGGDEDGDTEANDQPSQHAAHLANPFHRVPPMVSHMPLQTAPLFVWLPHLPDGVLRLPVFPILIDDSTRAATLLPARYWAHTQHYRDWLENADPKVPAETAPAFAALLAEEPDFWHDYPELVRPLPEELPDLGQSPEAYTAADSKLGRRLIKNYRTAAQSTYPRFAEDLPPEAEIARCTLALKENNNSETFPERIEKYARLRLADFSAVLMELADPAANRLLSQQPLPQAADTLSHELSPYQSARFVHGLMKQSKTNRTAAVYLAYLYTVGRFVPQSLYEAAAWANQAADAGDWRATKFLAEILLAVPQTAPELCYETISNDTYVILSDLKEAGLSTKEIEQQKKSYLNNPQAVLETVRRQLLRAAEQGDPIAQVRLQQLIDAEILPAQAPDARFTGIKNWLAIYAERSDQPAPLLDTQTLLKKPSADSADTPPPPRKMRRLLLLAILLGVLVWWFFHSHGYQLHAVQAQLLALWQNIRH